MCAADIAALVLLGIYIAKMLYQKLKVLKSCTFKDFQ
jgi:hypothetical protein